MDADTLRAQVLGKLMENTSNEVTTPVAEPVAKVDAPIIETKVEGESLVESALKHRLGTEKKEIEATKEERQSIIEKCDLSLIDRILNPRT